MPSIDDILDSLKPVEIVYAVLLARKDYRFTEESLGHGFSKASEEYPRLSSIDGKFLHGLLYYTQKPESPHINDWGCVRNNALFLSTIKNTPKCF